MTMITKRLPETSLAELVFTGTDMTYRGSMCVCYAPSLASYFETVTFLHPKELEYYCTLTYERRAKSYLAGRYAAKRSVSFFTREEHLDQVLIEQGILQQPIVVHPNRLNAQVSITHCDDLAAAVSFPEALPLGIDIERIRTDHTEVLETQMTDREKELIKRLPYSIETTLTILWTAKEALSKILRTGLTTPFTLFEISAMDVLNSSTRSYFTSFPQYYTDSYLFDHYVCSITYPKKTSLAVDAVGRLLADIERIIARKAMMPV
ncbi:4'-phosphopantetheinyl transferase superfamily protein [Brevibacillus humidisoli]|uniref:4'-phosphopantetheinyl transferase superfamily protein n=1 Tax=Brevibacillus humidisoli TaxID=2895522 RepID=UPI001E358030|nr:4'-phosphopantetheinyl transferase superfamily protein [Brevibacillus humidisoli]UFJ41781.1 4'-phosphopantetheinyl transferase superfamily protein [Brevibacillus humidisoli]